MNKNKKLKILWCGEASFLNTGYAIYAKEVLSRLHETGKYEIAELACYARPDSPKNDRVPWTIYPNMPVSEEESAAYDSNPKYQFGEWRFDYVCLDFQPDVVIDIRDWWMMEYQQRAVFRDFYKWIIMPTVDSRPQQEQYISTYMSADGVFTYSEFGQEVLEADSNGLLDVSGVASPGANFEHFKPTTNKEQHKDEFGFVEGTNIIGTIMRNQRRKLYPNLISSFREMLDNNQQLQKNTFLYIHTAFPDLGWDIPYFIKKYNMGNHTLFTYKCRSCEYFFPSFYQDSVAVCPKCSRVATMPTTAFGLSDQELSSVINCFDLYVQYSICEGFGMPQVEAAACGVPVVTVDYSAMSSVGRKIKADFVGISSYFWDSPTQSQRAIPDDKELIKRMSSFLKLPQSMKIKKGMDAYMGARRHYNWDKCAKVWEKHLDNIEPMNYEETWGSESRIQKKTDTIPENLTNSELVEWGMRNVVGMTEDRSAYIESRLVRDLNHGQSTMSNQDLFYDESSYIATQQSHVPFGLEDALEKMNSMRDYKNAWEMNRLAYINNKGWPEESKPTFLNYAKKREQ